MNPTQKPKLTRSQVGTLGGRAGRGDSKRRTPEQARKAVMVRWNRVKSAQQEDHADAVRENLTKD